MGVLVVLFSVVVVLLAVLVAGLLRSHAEILRALHQLGVGLDPADTPRDGLTVPRPRGRRGPHRRRPLGDLARG